MKTECDFFIDTFNDFLKTHNDEHEKALWKMKAILNLMNLTKGEDTGDLCENGLRMIMLLYNHYRIYPFDIRSDAFNRESLPDYREFTSILKTEFI